MIVKYGDFTFEGEIYDLVSLTNHCSTIAKYLGSPKKADFVTEGKSIILDSYKTWDDDDVPADN